MDIQRELKNDLTSIKGAIETQEGIYIPLKEVERILIKRIEQVKNNDLLHSVSNQRELLINYNAHLHAGYHSANYDESDVDEFLNID